MSLNPAPDVVHPPAPPPASHRPRGRTLVSLYAALLTLFPQRFRAEFGEEMREAFAGLVEEEAGRGPLALAALGLRELVQAPAALVRAHRFGGQRADRGSLVPVPGAAADLGFPAAPGLDGRSSWAQAALETLPFVITGVVLLLLAYMPVWPQAVDGGRPAAFARGWPLTLGGGWRYAWAAAGAPASVLAGAGLLLGLRRGLPRWAFSFAGLLLGCVVASAQRSGLAAVLVALPPAALGLAGAAWLTRSRSGAIWPGLPPLSSLYAAADPLRLSFAVYGALPLFVVMAYDDGFANNRTACLAVSVAVMAAGALAYARSRRPARQALALLGAASIAVWAAAVDRLVAGGSLAYGAGLAAPGWRLELWAAAAALLLASALPGLLRRTRSTSGAR